MIKPEIIVDANPMIAALLIGKRDPSDVDLLALTLKLGYPLWSHDRDFEHLAGTAVVSTETLLAEIVRLNA